MEGKVLIEQQGEAWVVRIGAGDRSQVYHCATQEQAQQLAKLLQGQRVSLGSDDPRAGKSGQGQ